jgi:hypothetical protein
LQYLYYLIPLTAVLAATGGIPLQYLCHLIPFTAMLAATGRIPLQYLWIFMASDPTDRGHSIATFVASDPIQ